TDSFATSIQTLQTQTQNNAAAIIAERDAWSSETDALAQQIEQLVADLGDGGAASLEEERQVRASEDEYLASLQRVLAAAEGVSSAAYQFQTTTRITAEEAEARRNEQLQAQIGDTQAAIQNEATVRANADSAQASQISALQSAASGNAAAIQQEANTRASADSVLSQQINTVQAAFDDELASVQQATQAQYNQTTQRLEAMWTLRLDVNGKVIGMGLANDGQTGTIGFRADRVYFAHPTNGNEVLPMIISGGQVLINDALINQLLFTKLRSSDGSLVFQNGRLQASYIAVDDLVVRQGQSSNYLPGQRGWRLTTTGGEINFPISFNNIQGGPPANADRTASNTAYDTARVNGVSAATVEDRAYRGAVGSNRVNNWTRPDSTLIDGNKIFTGDAYVDTLQIKGQAVTIPLSAYTAGAIVVGSEGGNNDVGGYRNYKDIQALWVPSLPGTTEILCSFRVVFQMSDGVGYPEVRLVENNDGNLSSRYQSRIDSGLNTFAVVIPPRPNGRTFSLQLRFGSTGALNPGGLQFHASNRLIRTLTLKDNR
ncbi:phage tail tip fiber protein, partial [Vreelandella aquamarina]|uniref:phage tail tip fiber protein n=1 Tax=Vreelandella aquamarina TaxID=77097 RepID=UPI001D18D183